MPILRSEHRREYTVVSNKALSDPNLSLRDIGLLMFLLSMPNDWQFTEVGLTTTFKRDGRTSVRSGLKALEDAGYLERRQERGNQGRMGGAVWIIREKPKPMSQKPMSENPTSENATQLNTNIQSTNIPSNTPSIILTDNTSPKGDAQSDDLFSAFWKAYPRKTAKPAAERAFRKAHISDLAALLADIERRKRTEDWQKDKGKYIPHPATYLNQRRWEDDDCPPEGDGHSAAAPPAAHFRYYGFEEES